MPLADLSGVAVVHGLIVQPFSGLWHADLVLAQATDITGSQVINFSGVPWVCAYVRAIDFSGERGVRVVAGAAGWRKTIDSKQYGAGVITTSLVCADAASACGELPPVIDASITPTVGTAFLRATAPASDVLQRLLGDAWWADRSGIIQTAPRGGSVSSAFQALAVKGASGIYEITSNSPNDWQPGVSFQGPTVSGTVSRVMHRIEPDRLRLEVMVS